MTEQQQATQEQEEFLAWKRKKELTARRRENRESYRQLVNDEMEAAVPELLSLSEQLKAVKEKVFENFRAVLSMKQEVMSLTHDGQRSHTFVNEAQDKRLTLGQYMLDAYDDTAEAGIAMVKEYISGLAKDKETQALVELVLRLLSKDQEGNLKASRVMQLRKLAQKSGNDRFIEGVEIIEEAYRPAASRTFLRLDVRGENGGWKPVPLGMTEAD